MPFYDYTGKKKSKKKIIEEKTIEPTVPSKLFLSPNDRSYQAPQELTYQIQHVNEERPVTPKYVLTHPDIVHIPETQYANAGSNTVEVKKLAASTMVDKDLIRKVNRGMNTDLLKDKVIVKDKDPKVNLYFEGFRTYYDDEANVYGVDCFMCCSNCWRNCNNVCRGCRNSISCPLYCWICFIAPLFIILVAGIAIGILIWTQQIKTISG